MSLHTQKLLHTEVFTQRSFYTQTCLDTEVFRHRSFYTQKHTEKPCHRPALWRCKIATILPNFLPVDLHFVRKGCISDFKIEFWHQFLTFNHSTFISREKVASEGSFKTAILHQFSTCDLHFVRKGCIWSFKIPILHQFFDTSVWRSKITTFNVVRNGDRWTRPGCPRRLKREFRRAGEEGVL